MLTWVFLLSCFVKNFYLILCTLLCTHMLSINIYVSSRQFYTIEPSFFKTTSRMHRRPFDGRHLVFINFIEFILTNSEDWIEKYTGLMYNFLFSARNKQNHDKGNIALFIMNEILSRFGHCIGSFRLDCL